MPSAVARDTRPAQRGTTTNVAAARAASAGDGNRVLAADVDVVEPRVELLAEVGELGAEVDHALAVQPVDEVRPAHAHGRAASRHDRYAQRCAQHGRQLERIVAGRPPSAPEVELPQLADAVRRFDDEVDPPTQPDRAFEQRRGRVVLLVDDPNRTLAEQPPVPVRGLPEDCVLFLDEVRGRPQVAGHAHVETVFPSGRQERVTDAPPPDGGLRRTLTGHVAIQTPGTEVRRTAQQIRRDPW